MKQIKITYIDDECMILETVKDLMELDSFSVNTCSDPKRAIEQIKEWQPEIILCDIMMPQIDGFELVKTIREDHEIAHIPIIFITAKNIDDNFRKSMNIGIDDYISKPFVIDDIKNAVKSRLKRYEEVSNVDKFDLKDQI
jgi:DNA-binding response OmpR family regulator